MTFTKLAGAYGEGQALLDEAAGNGLAEAPLARNRFLQLCGSALFGAAAVLFLPKAAWAHCRTGDHCYPHPCFGYPLCGTNSDAFCNNNPAGCCRGDLQACDPHCAAGWLGCPTGSSCWYCCHEGTRYKCCDCCRVGTRPCPSGMQCICRFTVGTCSTGCSTVGSGSYC